MEVREFSIGETAKATGLSVKTTRYYEQISLIPKALRHDRGARTGGNRLYTEADIGRLRFIHHARMLDLSLDDIRELLAVADAKGCPSDQPEYHEALRRHLHEIDERVHHLLGLREAIEELLSPEPRPKGEACSWTTCACMHPAHPAHPSSAPAEKLSANARK